MVAYDLAMVEVRVRFPVSALGIGVVEAAYTPKGSLENSGAGSNPVLNTKFLQSDGRGGSDPRRGSSGHPVFRKGYSLVTRAA